MSPILIKKKHMSPNLIKKINQANVSIHRNIDIVSSNVRSFLTGIGMSVLVDVFEKEMVDLMEFSCNSCERTFISLNDLNEHMPVHVDNVELPMQFLWKNIWQLDGPEWSYEKSSVFIRE